MRILNSKLFFLGYGFEWLKRHCEKKWFGVHRLSRKIQKPEKENCSFLVKVKFYKHLLENLGILKKFVFDQNLISN